MHLLDWTFRLLGLLLSTFVTSWADMDGPVVGTWSDITRFDLKVISLRISIVVTDFEGAGKMIWIGATRDGVACRLGPQPCFEGRGQRPAAFVVRCRSL